MIDANGREYAVSSFAITHTVGESRAVCSVAAGDLDAAPRLNLRGENSSLEVAGRQLFAGGELVEWSEHAGVLTLELRAPATAAAPERSSVRTIAGARDLKVSGKPTGAPVRVEASATVGGYVRPGVGSASLFAQGRVFSPVQAVHQHALTFPEAAAADWPAYNVEVFSRGMPSRPHVEGIASRLYRSLSSGWRRVEFSIPGDQPLAPGEFVAVDCEALAGMPLWIRRIEHRLTDGIVTCTVVAEHLPPPPEIPDARITPPAGGLASITAAQAA